MITICLVKYKITLFESRLSGYRLIDNRWLLDVWTLTIGRYVYTHHYSLSRHYIYIINIKLVGIAIYKYL